jgi:hypothetical protein
MRTTLNINIPKPCHEDWNQMTPKQKGRHCTSCKKTIFDFTRSTDEQIVKTFLKEDNVCGRFKSTQLNRELILNRKEKNNYLSYVASTLFAFLSFGTQDIQAQGKSRIVKVDSLQPQMVNGKTGTSILNKKPVRGTLFGPNKYRITGAKITIKGSAASTNTDMSGDFIIKGELGNILIINVDGFEKTEIIINNFASHQIYLKSKSQTRPIAISVIPVCDTKKAKTETITVLVGGVSGQVIINTSKKEEPLPIINGSLNGSSGYFLYSMRHMFRSKN